MPAQPDKVILIYLGAVILTLLITSAILLPNRRRSGAIHMLFINIALLVWAVSDLFCRIDCHSGFRWDALAYVGIGSIPPFLALLTVDYIGLDSFMKKRYLALFLFIVPAITVVLAFTNDLHGLIWETVTPVSVGSLTAYQREYGQFFDLQMSYSYALVILSLFIQGVVFTRVPKDLRLQAVMLIIASAFPLIANGVQIALSPIPGLDPTLMGGAIGSIIYTVIILRWLGIRVYYLANLALLNEFNSIMLIVNPKGIISYVKGPSGQKTALDKLQDHPLDEVLKPEQAAAIITSDHTLRIDQVEIDGEMYEANVAVVKSSRDLIEGRVILLRDVTLLKETIQREEKQHRLNEIMLKSISAINGTLDLSAVLDVILSSLDSIIPSDASNIMLIENGDQAYIERARGYEALGYERPYGNRHHYRDIPNLQRMIKTKRPVIISDTKSDARWVEGDYKTWQRSYAGIPLVSQREVIGFLNLNSLQPSAFQEDQSAILMLFADEAALAITNARLYESVKHNTEELEQRNTQLDAFAHTIAHDLRAPLQVVQGYLSLLEVELADGLSDDLKMAINDMHLGAQRMERLIRGLLLLSTEAGEVTLDIVDINAIVASLIEQFRWATESLGVQIAIEGELPPALGFHTWVESVFSNLIDNSVKYIGMGNKSPRVIIRGWRDGATSRYEVCDNGLGMTEAQLKTLFKAHERFGNDPIEGYGLGLSIVYRIIQRLGGQITAASEYGRGSTFTITLPATEEETP